MLYKEYRQCVTDFSHDEALSLTSSFDALCEAQDELIRVLVAKGAAIAGWKIVKQEGVLILSPIFDFQLLSAFGESIDQKAIKGTELELCFRPFVPSHAANVHDLVESLPALAAVELIRPGIHRTNHPVCDFYFHYSVLLSEQAVTGEMAFSAGNQEYRFLANVNEVIAEKKAVLMAGITQCIARGYGGQAYFFITGTLNGLVSVEESIGLNQVLHQNEVIMDFNVR